MTPFYKETCEREDNRMMVLKTLAKELQSLCPQNSSEKELWSRKIIEIDKRRRELKKMAKEAPSLVDEMTKEGRPRTGLEDIL